MGHVETKIISGVLRQLAHDIDTEGGVASAACYQAADRLDQQEKLIPKIGKNIFLRCDSGEMLIDIICETLEINDVRCTDSNIIRALRKFR